MVPRELIESRADVLRHSLTTLWPCAEQRNRYDALRAKVVDACYGAGVDPPPPGVNTSLDIRA